MIRFNFAHLISLLFLLTSAQFTTAKECPSTYFDCGDGSCVSFLFLCDGEKDCENGKDEECYGSIHKVGVHAHYATNFTLPKKCEGFKCGTGECLSHKLRCNNILDCSDGSDEAACKPSRFDPHCVRKNGRFECASGKCISYELVCNNHNDCPGGDDEGKYCDIDGCHSKNCTHGCSITLQGAQCNCNDGFKLDIDKRTCIDIDECEYYNDVCSQKCTNKEGSFTCSCETGFKLVNQTKCVVESAEPVLLYTDKQNIRGYWLNKSYHFLIARALTQATGIDMHRDSRLVFWTDIGENSSFVFSAHFNNKGIKAVVTNGLKTPEDIAVDHLANNLYITDSGLKQIIVCKLDGSSCTLIIKHGIDKVRAIALDIEHGKIFWTDWGSKPGIYTARMDGSEMRVLVNRNTIWPNGLTYDKFKNRIYWSDVKLQRIEYYDLTKNKRFVLIDDDVYNPYCLTMFEDNLYWADWNSYSISRSNKFTGFNMTTIFKRPNKVYGMHVYHPVLYSSSVNPCRSASCSHLCLIVSANEFKCACPNNMKLDPENKTSCIEQDESSYLLISLNRDIKKVWPENIGKDVTQSLIKNLPIDLNLISEYAYSLRHNELYFYSMHAEGIYKYSLDTHTPSVMYENSNLTSLYSMVYDEFSDNLYWLNADTNQLMVASVDGKKQIVLLDKLTVASSLVLYQERNKMFIGLMDEKPRIMVADLDGKNMKIFVENIGLPTALAICKETNQLYFADAKNGTIGSISIDDLTSKTIISSGLGYVESIVIRNKKLHYTHMDTPYMHTIDLDNVKGKIRQTRVGTFSMRPKKLVLAYKQTIDNDCLGIKNKCSGICLFNGFKRIGQTKVPLTHCVCSIDDSLAKDKKTCEPKSCADGFFTCHSTKTCIKQSEVCDGYQNCENNEDELNCSVRSCGVFKRLCNPKDLNSPCIPNSWFCDGEADCPNNFDEQNCVYNA